MMKLQPQEIDPKLIEEDLKNLDQEILSTELQLQLKKKNGGTTARGGRGANGTARKKRGGGKQPAKAVKDEDEDQSM